MPVIYTFEAKSIQSYIFDSSQLQDIVGASEQIEALTHVLLDKVLQALKLTEGQNIQFSLRTGAAFIAILKTLEKAENLRDLWTFTVRSSLPGLKFVQCLQQNTNVLVAEQAVLRHKWVDRNYQFPIFPIAGPFVARNLHTGEPAITSRTNEFNGNIEFLDKATAKKREFLQNIWSHFNNTTLTLEKKLSLQTTGRLVWPLHMHKVENDAKEPYFPTLKNNHYISIIYANGNELEKLFMGVRDSIQKIPHLYGNILNILSITIEKITVLAAQQALQQVLVPQALEYKDAQRKTVKIIPARPLVLSGHELTMLVRGDLAIPFTQQFLEAFEYYSEQELTLLIQSYYKTGLKKVNLPKSLTACAGIAFIKTTQPFHLASKLAQSLCQLAQKSSQQFRTEQGIPSSLAFHRITNTIMDDYDMICQRELSTPAGFLLSMQPYGVGSIQPSPQANPKILPRLHDLDKLRQLLAEEKMSQGATRELLNLLSLSPSDAKQAFKRWHQKMQKIQWDGYQEFENVLKNMLVETDPELPVVSQDNRSPLADALTWNSITRGSNV